MKEILKYFNTTMYIGRRPICNLRFTDDIDIVGSSENESQDLTIRLEEKATIDVMEVSSETNKVQVNSPIQDTPINIMMEARTLRK